MTFTSRDFKDVADLVARKLELYMNMERRELRFNPEGCFRTTQKMEDYDLLFRVDDSLAKTDKARSLLGPAPDRGKSARRNQSPKGPKAKRSKSSAGQNAKTSSEKKKSKVSKKGSKSSKSIETQTVDKDDETSESERGKIEEKSEDVDTGENRETKDQKADDPDQEEKYWVDNNSVKKEETDKKDDDPQQDEIGKDQEDGNTEHDKESTDQEGNNRGGYKTKDLEEGNSRQNKESKDERDENPAEDKKANDLEEGKEENNQVEDKEENNRVEDKEEKNREEDKVEKNQIEDNEEKNRVEDKEEKNEDKEAKEESSKSSMRGKVLHKENKPNKKQRRKNSQEKPYINPKLIDTSRQVMPVREFGRLTSFANDVFSEQPVEKLQIIHRYRPNSDDIPHITENGKVQNYTCHVGSALHSTKYLDYYIKEGLQTGKKDHSKRLQQLKPGKITEKSGQTPVKNQAIMSDGKRQNNGSQRRKTALITADPLALVRPSSSASTGSTRSTSYGYSSSSYNSDFTTSYNYCRNSSSSPFSTSASAESSLILPPSKTASLPNIKTAWVMTPRSSTEFLPTPFSSKDDVDAEEKRFYNRQLSDEDSCISLSSVGFSSKYDSPDQKSRVLKPHDLVKKLHHHPIAVEETCVKENCKKNPVLETKQNTVVSENDDFNFKALSLAFENTKSTGCVYDEFYDGSVSSMYPLEHRGDDENRTAEDPEHWRGNWCDGNQNLKEEYRGSIEIETFKTNFSLISPSSMSNFCRSSAYVHVPEERGNDSEVLFASEEENPFYVTADHPLVERSKMIEDDFEKSCTSSRGILPKLNLKQPQISDRSGIDMAGDDTTDTGKHVQTKQNEETLPHGRGTRKGERRIEVERSQSRSSQSSVERETSLDSYMKDELLVSAEIHPVTKESIEFEGGARRRLISSRASVGKYIPDDLPSEAQYIPTKSVYGQIQNTEQKTQELSRGPEFGSEKENQHDSGSSRASEMKPESCNNVPVLDLLDSKEKEKTTSESAGSRGTFPVSVPSQNENSSGDNGRSSLKSESQSDKESDYMSVVIQKSSDKPTRYSMQMFNASEIQDYPVVENYVPSPRSMQRIDSEPKPAASVDQNADKLKEAKEKQKQIGHKPLQSDPVKTIVSAISVTGQTIYVDNNSESCTDGLKDNTSAIDGTYPDSMKSALDEPYMDSKNIPDLDYSNLEKDNLSSSLLSLKSLDIKPGTIPPPSSKVLKGNVDQVKGENTRPASSASVTSSRGTDSEKRSDSSLKSENNNTNLYSVSKTTSRGSDSPQSSTPSSCSSRTSLKKKLIPLDSSLLSSSGRAITRGVDSRKRRTRKSNGSKQSTQSSTDEDSYSITSSKRASEKGKPKIAKSRSTTGEDGRSLSLLSTSASITETPEKESVPQPKTDSDIESSDSIQQTLVTGSPTDKLASYSGRIIQKQYSISSSTTDSVVNDKPAFSSSASETSAKDDTEQGTSFMTTHSWSMSSKDSKKPTPVVSTSYTSSNQSVSNHTSQSNNTISRGDEIEVEGLVIDMNSKPPIIESAVIQKHITDVESSKSETDVQVLSELESDGSRKKVKTLTTSGDIHDVNGDGRTSLPDIVIPAMEEAADFVLCSPEKSYQGSMSAADQTQDIYSHVDGGHAETPVVSSRGSETGDSSDNKSKSSDLAHKLRSLQQKNSESFSRELSPRIDSRSSSNLSQASLTKVNFQQKEKEVVVVSNVVVENDNEASRMVVSSHTATEYISTKPVTGYPLCVNNSSPFEQSENDLPVGIVFDLKEEQDAERGDIVSSEYSNDIKMEFAKNEDMTAEYQTTFPKQNGLQTVNGVDSENGQSLPEFRGELSDDGMIDDKEDKASPEMGNKVGIINTQESETIEACLTEEQLTYIRKDDQSEETAVHADVTSQTQQSGQLDRHTTDAADVEHTLMKDDQPGLENHVGGSSVTVDVIKESQVKKDCQPGLENHAGDSSVKVDIIKESQVKEDDDFMLSLASRIKKSIPAISVSEDKPVEEILSRDETNDEGIVEIRDALQMMSGEVDTEASVDVATVHDQDKVCTATQSISVKQCSNENLIHQSVEKTQESVNKVDDDVNEASEMGNKVGVVNTAETVDKDLPQIESTKIHVSSTPETQIAWQELFRLSEEDEQKICEAPSATEVTIQHSKAHTDNSDLIVSHSLRTEPLQVLETSSSVPSKDNSSQNIALILEVENKQDNTILSPSVDEASLPQMEDIRQESLAWPKIEDVLQMNKSLQEMLPSPEITKIPSNFTPSQDLKIQLLPDISPSSRVKILEIQPEVDILLPIVKSPPLKENSSNGQMVQDITPSQTQTEVLDSHITQLPSETIETYVLPISPTKTEVLETVVTPLAPKTTQTDELETVMTPIAPETMEKVVTLLPLATTEINVLPVSQLQTEVLETVVIPIAPETTQIEILPISQTKTEELETVVMPIAPQTTQIEVLPVSQTKIEELETVVMPIAPQTTQIEVLQISQTKIEELETVVMPISPQTTQIEVLPVSQTKIEELETVVMPIAPQTTQIEVLPVSQTKIEELETVVMPISPQTTQIEVLPVSQTKIEELETVVMPIAPQTTQIEVLPVSQTKIEELETVVMPIAPQTTQIEVLPVSQTKIEELETVVMPIAPQTTQTEVFPVSQTKIEELETVVMPIAPQTTQINILPISQTKIEELETIVIPIAPETTQIDIQPISQTETDELEKVVTQLPPETTQINILSVSQMKTDEEWKQVFLQ